MCSFFNIIFCYSLSQNLDCSSLCYTVVSCFLSIPYIITCISVSVNLFHRCVHLWTHLKHCISDPAYKWYHTVFVSVCLTSLSLISRSVFMLLQMALFHSLLWLSRIPLSTHSSVLTWGTPGSQGWRSLVGCSLWGRSESDTRDLAAAAAAGFHCTGFPGGTSGKEPTCQCRRHKGCGFNPWVRKIPWERAWQHTPAFLLGESHGQRSLMSFSPWGSQRVGHNWSNLACRIPLCTHTHTLTHPASSLYVHPLMDS